MNQGGALACCSVCKLETHRRCSRCLSIYYCNKEHQREDWKRHKSECTPKLGKQASTKVVTDANKNYSKEEEFNQGEGKPHKHISIKQECVSIEDKSSSNSKNKSFNEGSTNAHLSKQNLKTGSTSIGCCSTSKYVSQKIANELVQPVISKGNSVISSVVCTNNDSVKQSAITYEGSSETEILSESAQQLSTVGFMGHNNTTNVLKSVNRTVDGKMAVMPGIVPEIPSRLSHKEYPEASLKGSSVLNNFYLDSSDPCYQICQRVIRDMTTYGVCVLDNFLGRDRGLLVRQEVLDMYRSGIFKAGQLVSDPGGTGTQSVRSDRITWIDGREPQCYHIGTLINQVDSIILRANKMPNNGKIGDYIINTRTKAMVACYPGSGSNYVKHVDNPNRDGRCITAIYYLNLDWDTKRSGGLLRVFPEGTDQVANIAPIFDRMLFFWSDRRNPHEVQPAFDTRYAITLWYFDAQEREEARRLFESRRNQPSSSK